MSNKLYRIKHEDCGKIFRFVTQEQAEKRVCPVCRHHLNSLIYATIGLEKSKQSTMGEWFKGLIK